MAFEIRRSIETEMAIGNCELGSVKQCAHVIALPDIKLAFLMFRVDSRARCKKRRSAMSFRGAAMRRCLLAAAANDSDSRLLAPERQQLCVVVKHLFRNAEFPNARRRNSEPRGIRRRAGRESRHRPCVAASTRSSTAIRRQATIPFPDSAEISAHRDDRRERRRTSFQIAGRRRERVSRQANHQATTISRASPRRFRQRYILQAHVVTARVQKPRIILKI